LIPEKIVSLVERKVFQLKFGDMSLKLFPSLIIDSVISFFSSL